MGKDFGLKLTEEEENALTPALVAVAKDLVANENVSKSDLAKLYVFSQQNCKMILARLKAKKNLKAVELDGETLRKLGKFMNASRTHPLAGGQRFKSEDEALSFLLDLALKFGFKFLETMLDDCNFKNITGSMKPEDFDDEDKRKAEVNEALEEAEEDGESKAL